MFYLIFISTESRNQRFFEKKTGIDAMFGKITNFAIGLATILTLW